MPRSSPTRCEPRACNRRGALTRRPGRCTTGDRRGPAICGNRTLLRHEVLDAAFLDAIRNRLDDGLIRDAVTRVVALWRKREGATVQRRPAVERELVGGRRATHRALGGCDHGRRPGRRELLERLRAEHARKAALVDEQHTLNASGRRGRGELARATDCPCGEPSGAARRPRRADAATPGRDALGSGDDGADRRGGAARLPIQRMATTRRPTPRRSAYNT
jgi:hypothetical protein